MIRYIVTYEFRVEASDRDGAAVAARDAYNERDFQNVTIVEEEPQDGMNSLLALLEAAQRRRASSTIGRFSRARATPRSNWTRSQASW